MRTLILWLALWWLPMMVHAADADRQDYILGTGDMVRITVYGSPDLTTEARLSASGSITFPLLGEIAIGGESPAAVEKKIADQLEKGGFIKQPQVNLVVVQFQSQQVSVLGDVLKAGRYPLEKPTSLSEVLALAGGASPNGSDIVSVIGMHGGKTEKRDFDLRELYANGDSASNPKVGSDDIVYINARQVSVLGQVNRPGKYSVIGGVRNVVDFLSQAGGISPNGGDIIIVVTQRNGKTVKREIDVDQLFRSGDMTFNAGLNEGDVIYVPRAPMFYIYGEVQRPGAFRLERNMTVAQALATGGGLTQHGTERGISIKRRSADGTFQTISSKPSDLLREDDVIQVQESLI